MEVHDVLWDLLKDVQIDAKQRQLIWPDAERLDLEQSIQRIQKLYPDFPRDEVEEFVLNWIDMGYYPENYSQAQLRRNSTSLTASQSNGSPTISERAQKNERELGTLEFKQDGVSPREVLEGFIRNLCALDGSHGSDERDKAQACYDRCGYPYLNNR
jgi:hypothetical protein